MKNCLAKIFTIAQKPKRAVDCGLSDVRMPEPRFYVKLIAENAPGVANAVSTMMRRIGRLPMNLLSSGDMG